MLVVRVYSRECSRYVKQGQKPVIHHHQYLLIYIGGQEILDIF
jgi:hypothetical protein